MPRRIDPQENYQNTREAIGYVSRNEATQSDYDRIGFMSGLEVHQQLKTHHKLFCRCPAGQYQKPDDFDAEIIRHMRPTLSELGEYDGTALMEFKTRKTIIYRIKSPTACTYEIDDTPPFRINQQALEQAIQLSLLCKLNIVGEVHITRKQYLDGSIPTGFQRTAIIGVEGEIPLRNKKIRLLQLSLEEDSCREVSDKGHLRVYRTDRLGMPLIETVTYPDMVNPDEVKEACNYIRFLNRSSGQVRVGIGSGRQDVNVSCRGGTRVEIKGVSHTRWIPKLTHNEAFRQWALLHIREILRQRESNYKTWKIQHQIINPRHHGISWQTLSDAKKSGHQIVAINLRSFCGILSHFTQPGKIFADELSERLKVIACIDKPHMIHSEQLEPTFDFGVFESLAELFDAGVEDAQLVVWGPPEDIPTALETIEERCMMAFEEVPRETRKSFEDGTTIFERVLPGADRMYPDTDSPPIPLDDQLIQKLKKGLPEDVIERYRELKSWGVPEDTFTYIFRNDLFGLIVKIKEELGFDPIFTSTLLAHNLKNIEGRYVPASGFSYKIIYGLFKYLKEKHLDRQLAKKMLPTIYQYPKMEFDSVLATMKFKSHTPEDILARVSFLQEKFRQVCLVRKNRAANELNWIMGQLRPLAVGNVSLALLRDKIKQSLT